ncbi:unnamed protein product [Cuscuta campestris]|uniref:Uncharacterized protein n=1 Tax=Cuscuta campestris TaxID=132261 RepID=A0A484LF01_9ASTE|nr:unnamed protein product [Cuscuta campestris]VFQ75136.1 unnamed protein product [Cuscuta campestris]
MENVIFYCVAVSVLLFPLLVVLRNLAPKHTRKPPPSPLALPVIGHLYLIKNALHHSLASLSAKYGPVLLLRFGCRSILLVSSPFAVEECFTKNDIAFANRPRTMAGDRLTYNYTAFVWAPYGQLWRLQRRFATVELFSAASLHRSSVIREGEARTLVRALCRLSETTGRAPVDLKSLAATLTFNSMMRLVAGRRCVEEKDVGRAKGNEIVKGLRGIFFASLSVMNTCDFFPVLRFLGYKGMEKKLVSFHKKRDEFLSGMLDEFRRQKTKLSDSGGADDGDDKSLIQTLLSLQDSEPEFYTDDLIKSTILMMFVAGTETSSATIECAMSELLANPEAMRKLRSEIDNVVVVGRPDQQRCLVKESDLPKLPYLRRVVNETLRLHPPAPLLLPHCSSEDCVIGGYDVPRNTILMVNAWGLHRDPAVWEEPEKFLPERFGATEEAELGENGWKFLPFGMGRRACPGNNMGLRMVSLALAALVQCFDWEIDDDDDGSMVAKAKEAGAVSSWC